MESKKILSVSICLCTVFILLLTGCENFNFGFPDETEPSVELSASSTSIAVNETVTITADPSGFDSDSLTYTWYMDDTDVTQEADGASLDFYHITAGTYTIKAEATDGTDSAQATIDIEVTSGSGGTSSYSFTETASLTKTDIGISADTSVTSLTVSSDGNTILIGTDDWESQGLFYSTDGGTSWTEINSTDTDLPDDDINCVYIDGNTWYIGTWSGLAIIDTTSSPYTITSILSSAEILSITVSDTHVYLGANEYIDTTEGLNDEVISVDKTNTATIARSPELNSTINDIAVDGDNIYAATQEDGLYIGDTSDVTASWTNYSLSEGLSSYSVGSVYVDSTHILLGTDGISGDDTTETGISYTADSGSNWNVFTDNSLFSSNAGIVSDSGNMVITAQYGGPIFVSENITDVFNSIAISGYPVFSTNLGGPAADDIAIDANDNIYILHSSDTPGLIIGTISSQ